MKKYLLLFIIAFSCNNNNIENNYPGVIVDNNLGDIYDQAKWMFYASNSHSKFRFVKSSGIKDSLEDILSVEVKLFDFAFPKNDTVTIDLVIDYNSVDGCKYGNIDQPYKFNRFVFLKHEQKMLERKISGLSFPKRMQGNLFNRDDSGYRYADSCHSGGNMRKPGLYPIHEQDSILISKLKSNRKDINPWLRNYAKKRGFIK